MRNSNVENFDFQTLVNAFDQAQAANPGLNAWGATNALLDAVTQAHWAAIWFMSTARMAISPASALLRHKVNVS